uniref:Lipocalin/cytosolic fatty-acid binding domain-containing protein n=1 Tax=Propithecus coquereli TaxID=379532 RepID=A0A2K6EJL5_PROCO
MKALLLMAVLGLVAALSLAQEEQDFSGTWYVKAMVTGKDVPEEKRPRKVSPVIVTTLEGGDMEVTITFMKQDQCHQRKMLMQKTDEPGKFHAHEGQKTVYVQELPGTDHYVFYCEAQRHGKLFHMAKLMVPGPTVAVSSRYLLPAHLVRILLQTQRPWKNSRNSCSARGSWRRTSSCPHRRVRECSAGVPHVPQSAPLESTLLPDRASGLPRPVSHH